MRITIYDVGIDAKRPVTHSDVNMLTDVNRRYGELITALRSDSAAGKTIPPRTKKLLEAANRRRDEIRAAAKSATA